MMIYNYGMGGVDAVYQLYQDVGVKYEFIG